MKSYDALRRAIGKINGARIVKVPTNMRPTIESIKSLNNEINFQIEANRRMRYKSIHRTG